MSEELFGALEEKLAGEHPSGSLDFLIGKFRRQQEIPLLFEARLMKKRLDLGLPLIQTESAASFPAEARRAYEEEMVEAAREAGSMFLAKGEIDRAWPYLRAIGETGPVKEAIERLSLEDATDAVIQIALQEGVHPAKGLALVLGQHGMCRAITCFGMYPIQEDREACIALLVRSLSVELAGRLKDAIESREGKTPEASRVGELIDGREWLFGEYDYYVDTSHLISVIQYSLETTERDTLLLIRDLCRYGRRLSKQFHFRGQPPFEDVYTDYGMYVQALLGEDVEAAMEHFRRKVAASDPEEAGYAAAEAVVKLLVRLGRFTEALEISLSHLRDLAPAEISCPSVLQLCHMAGDFERLMDLARERGDVLSYTAAALERTRAAANP
ncbi:MAG: hypothetical protein HY235_00315 [Acidobacteria bacterium]|nr:hypothetical protein [Acidobacteriota bacterium]